VHWLRTGAAGSSVVGGLIWLLAPLVSGSPSLWFALRYDLLLVAASALVAVGLVGLYGAYGRTHGTVGRAGLTALGVGVLLLGLAPLSDYLVVTLPVGVAMLAGATVGALLAEAGTLGVAAAARRTGEPSKRLAVWLPLALPASVLTNFVGASVLELYFVGRNYYVGLAGLAWIAVGYHLLRSVEADTAG
jgi:hypothetical protein